MCHIEEFAYYLEFRISFEVILKYLNNKQKVATTIMFTLSGNKLCGKAIEIGCVVVVVQEVFEPNTVVPYAKVTTDKCHTNTKISKGIMIFWSNKFMKIVNDALAHNANVV
jgi:hypothetical protein